MLDTVREGDMLEPIIGGRLGRDILTVAQPKNDDAVQARSYDALLVRRIRQRG
jgi:hypothetical protein